MPLRKIKRKIQSIKFHQLNYMNLTIAIICIFIGYVIAVLSNTGQDGLKEIQKIKSYIGSSENLEELKGKIKNDPKLLEKINSRILQTGGRF